MYCVNVPSGSLAVLPGAVNGEFTGREVSSCFVAKRSGSKLEKSRSRSPFPTTLPTQAKSWAEQQNYVSDTAPGPGSAPVRIIPVNVPIRTIEVNPLPRL
jgi:hypothetical protein